MMTETKENDIKIVELNKKRVIQTPNQRMTFIKNNLNLPNKISYKQKSVITVSSIKYEVNDLDNDERTMYKCKSKTTSESFELSDLSGSVLFKFSLKKVNSKYFDFIITDCTTGKEKTATVKTLPSMTKNIYQVQFINEENGKEESLYFYLEDQSKRYVFYGGIESEGGELICKAIGNYENIKYLIEFASNIDRTFVFMLLFSLNRYLNCHPKDIPGNFVFMGQNNY